MRAPVKLASNILIFVDFVFLVWLFGDPWENESETIAWTLTIVFPALAFLTCLFGRLNGLRSERYQRVIFVIALSMIASLIGNWFRFISHI